jgi:cold shock CspA family protein
MNRHTGEPENNKNIGEVVWFKKGYGFIKWSGHDDLFVHFSDVIPKSGSEYRTLKAGQVVEFNVGENHRGQKKAIDVIVI